jgi:hypothetical protein
VSTFRLTVTGTSGIESAAPGGNAAVVVPAASQAANGTLHLRAGEWVEVRSLAEILETLDADGSLGGLPFMPEMAPFCGRTFRVFKSAHKTCDTIETYTIRRMESAVHLEGVHCDGAAHGGCQAGCLIFWKEAWLKRAAGHTRGDAHESEPSPSSTLAAAPTPADVELLQRATRPAGDPARGDDYYRCQATDLRKATIEVRRRQRWDPRFYVRDLTSGNVRVRDFVWYGMLAMFNALTRRWLGRRYPHVCGLAGSRTPVADKRLQAGELVRVRSKQEIMETLSPGLRNRGLWFDVEMVPYCESGPFPVLRRVERIVDEKTGRLLRLPTPCVILDGVTCSGHLSADRMFCPRNLYPYWREIWLDRADAITPDGSDGDARHSDVKS